MARARARTGFAPFGRCLRSFPGAISARNPKATSTREVTHVVGNRLRRLFLVPDHPVHHWAHDPEEGTLGVVHLRHLHSAPMAYRRGDPADEGGRNRIGAEL